MIEKLDNLTGSRWPHEQTVVTTEQSHVVRLDLKMAVEFRDYAIVLAGHDSNVFLLGFGQLANKTGWSTGELTKSFAKRKHISNDARNWGAMVGTGEHHDPS